MQPVAGVAQDALDLVPEKALQGVGEALRHAAWGRHLATGFRLNVLRDVAVREVGERAHRVGHGRRGHAPGANGRARHVHGVPALRQPLPEQMAIEVIEDEPLGATGRSRHQADVVRLQARCLDVATGAFAHVDVQGLHGRQG